MHTDPSARQLLAEEKWIDLREQMRIARLEGRAARRSRSRRAAQLAQMRSALEALLARLRPHPGPNPRPSGHEEWR
jgi:hypothetical protein